MKFLREIGISKKTVAILTQELGEEGCISAELCSDKIISSIEYLKSKGMENNVIEEILLEDYHYLVPGKDKIEKAVNNFKKGNLVEFINKDLSYMDYLINF